MRNIVRSLIVLVCAGASFAYGAVPQISVTVSDSSGKAAYKGATRGDGTFATSALKPGNYVVQLNSNSAPKSSKYAVVISAGKKKVTANVVGAKFAAGGVAMKIDVGAGTHITGQVAADTSSAGDAPIGHNGKPMVWIPRQLGSNLAAHWAESDSAEAKAAQTAGSMSRQDLQNRQSQGISLGGN